MRVARGAVRRAAGRVAIPIRRRRRPSREGIAAEALDPALRPCDRLLPVRTQLRTVLEAQRGSSFVHVRGLENAGLLIDVARRLRYGAAAIGAPRAEQHGCRRRPRPHPSGWAARCGRKGATRRRGTTLQKRRHRGHPPILVPGGHGWEILSK
eukprot:gene4444-biopygen4485